MDYRILGRTGAKVSPLCLGAMMFGQRGNADHDDSIRIIHRALDAGINIVDTANVYSTGESEEIVGKALRGRRDRVILATKVHGVMGDGPNDQGNSRIHILREVENSLRRLQTDYIDLYQIHRPDPTTPIDETLSALDSLVKAGKVRYIGSSTFSAWQLIESYWTSSRLNIARFACEQPPYSLLSREIERDVLPVCQKYGTGVIVWSPLERGWLTGKYQRSTVGHISTDSRMARDRFIVQLDTPAGQRRLAVIDELLALAGELGVPLAHYALAWTLLNHTVTAPIIGPRTMDQLEDNLAALDVSIPVEHQRKIDALLPPGTNLA